MWLLEYLDELGYAEARSASTTGRVRDHRVSGSVYRRRCGTDEKYQARHRCGLFTYHHPSWCRPCDTARSRTLGRFMLGVGPGGLSGTPTGWD